MTPTDNQPAALPVPRPAVDALVATLGQERDALDDLARTLELHLDALRVHHPEAMQDATDAAGHALGEMNRLRLVRERQARLLGRVLGTDDLRSAALVAAVRPRDAALAGALAAAFEAVRARVRTTQRRADELAFALDLAVRVGRELMHAWQHLDAPAPARVYTANGASSEATPPRSFVNHVG